MTILDDQNAEIVRRVAQLEMGAEFSLRGLYGEDFDGIGTSGQRKRLGTLFRAAVDRGEFPTIAYSHHSDSPSEHWYRRVS